MWRSLKRKNTSDWKMLSNCVCSKQTICICSVGGGGCHSITSGLSLTHVNARWEQRWSPAIRSEKNTCKWPLGNGAWEIINQTWTRPWRRVFTYVPAILLRQGWFAAQRSGIALHTNRKTTDWGCVRKFERCLCTEPARCCRDYSQLGRPDVGASLTEKSNWVFLDFQ